MPSPSNTPWTNEQFARWYSEKPIIASRDYVKTLVPRIQALANRIGFTLERYGDAKYSTLDAKGKSSKVTHPLLRLLIGDFDPLKPCYFILGGTHGYEKGGPLAALSFAENQAKDYLNRYNLVIYPCLSPGPYEKELRFTEGRIDINRDAFLHDAKTQEMQAFALSIQELHTRLYGKDSSKKFTAAIDLHETPKMDIEIDKESALAGGELFKLSLFPKGLFLIAFDDDLRYAQHIISQIKTSQHHVVDDATIYDAPNHGGILLMSEMGKVTGRVRQLMKLFTHASFTTEYCDEELTDATPEHERVDPQLAAINAMLNFSELN